jgi:alpha-L-fucosidase 2
MVAAKTYFKHDGAFFPEIMEHWGASYGMRDTYQWDPANPKAPQLWWGKARSTVLGRGNKADLTTPPGWYWQSGIEMVALMLSYCDHTGDTVFRDQKLLPFAREILKFYEIHWPRNRDGKLNFFPLSSIEAIQNASNPMPDVAGLHFILPQLIACTADDQQKSAWRKMLAELPPLPAGGKAGQQRLLPAESGNRHSGHENPELYAVWPYTLYGAGRPDIQVALNAWNCRVDRKTCGWEQNGIQAAMLGLTSEAKAIVVANVQKRASGFRFPGFFGPNFDWIPDQDHASTNMRAFQAMAMQINGNQIIVLPAWPKDWDVDFRLHAPLDTTVECVVRDGKMVKLLVTPESRRKDVEVCKMFEQIKR